MMGYGYNMMGSWLGMMIIPLIFIVILVVVVFKLGQSNNAKDIKDNSLNILNERFARGEINEDEYKRKKDLLKKY